MSKNRNIKTRKIKINPGAILKSDGSAKFYHTGSWRNQRPEVDFKKCIQCLMCANYCPEDCIPVVNDKRQQTDLNYCKGCGICAAICPVKAINMKRSRK